jgi:lipopolysaccharide transport system permease protein
MSESQLVPVKETSSEIVLIRPTKKWVPLDLKELWRFRELIYFMTWRDVKVRYAQTILGATWVILQPLIQTIVFNFVFGTIAGLPTDGIPRPLFTYAGLLGWNLFSKGLTNAGNSMVSNRNMITKIYFPRLILPLSAILSGLVDFVVSSVIMVVLMIIYKTAPTANAWYLPLFLLLSIITSLGVGLWLAPLNVHYRDVRFIIPLGVQLLMYLSPIAYPLSSLSENMRWVFAINPMVGVVEGFRWALFGTERVLGNEMWLSIGVAIVMFVTGIFYFRSMEKTFSDAV